jgi:RHS repeat-associated protein
VVSYTYDLKGNRIAKTLANGVSASYGYDDANRLLSLVHSNSVGLFARFDYALNKVGNRTNKTVTTPAVVLNENYTYDAIDQIAAVAYATNAVPMRNVSYQYDAVGNRTQTTEDGSPTGYTANDLNQYTVVDGSSLGYDTKGNLTSTTGGILGNWTYTYDAQNRLVSASGGPSSVTASFAYDARNRCVARTANNVTTYLLWDDWSLIEERDTTGTLQARYIHGAQIDEILLRETPNSQLPTPIYYHHDALGSTVALTDSQGLIAESYAYDAFGTPSFFDSSFNPQPSSLLNNRFLFTGREFLADLGLHDYRNRFYSQVLGRFLQTDPIGFGAEDVNLYRYVGNEPVNLDDPHGLFGEGSHGTATSDWDRGHSDFMGSDRFDWTREDTGFWSHPYNPVTGTPRHFQPLDVSIRQVNSAIGRCNKAAFESAMHRMQDYWTHYRNTYRTYATAGHLFSGTSPDRDKWAWRMANNATQHMLNKWNAHCCECKGKWYRRDSGHCK